MPAFRRLYPSSSSDGCIDPNDIFGNLFEGKPKTIYYLLIPACHASAALLFSRGFKTFNAGNAGFGVHSLPRGWWKRKERCEKSPF